MTMTTLNIRSRKKTAGRLGVLGPGGLLLLLLVLSAPASGQQAADQAPAQASQRPNIIFVFTDDHATHAISAYGSQINTTPHIDRLAEEGMLFRNAFVANSICAPSRAAILTGQFGHHNGIKTNGNRFDSTQTTFPKRLQAAGYQTAMIGKWHLKTEPTGFDYWEVLPGQGTYYNPDFLTRDGRVERTGYVTNIITDRALRWLRQGREQEQPFLLMYQHKAPHRNWLPGPEYLSMYEGETIPVPETLFDDWEGRTSAAQKQKMTIAEHLRPGWDLKIPGEQGWDRLTEQFNDEQLERFKAAYERRNDAFYQLEGRALTRWKYQRYIKDYLRSVAAVDDNLGRLLAYLESSGLAENTVVVYASDQGFYLGDHGWFDKRWMYEESLKMPLIVRWPGVTAPDTENRNLVQNIDLAETFLDMAGADLPASMQGRSLVPLLKGETPADWRDGIYYQYFEYPGPHNVAPHYGVRTRHYKLIRYPTEGEWELFDLENDPDEMNSVYGDPSYEEVQRRLKKQLRQLRAQYEAPPPRVFRNQGS